MPGKASASCQKRFSRDHRARHAAQGFVHWLHPGGAAVVDAGGTRCVAYVHGTGPPTNQRHPHGQPLLVGTSCGRETCELNPRAADGLP